MCSVCRDPSALAYEQRSDCLEYFHHVVMVSKKTYRHYRSAPGPIPDEERRAAAVVLRVHGGDSTSGEPNVRSEINDVALVTGACKKHSWVLDEAFISWEPWSLTTLQRSCATKRWTNPTIAPSAFRVALHYPYVCIDMGKRWAAHTLLELRSLQCSGIDECDGRELDSN